MTEDTSKWDQRFLDIAHAVAGWSKDPSTRVGAVVVRPDRTIASMGYNGFPRGASDDANIYASRPLKLLRTVHAELNAILSASSNLAGCTIYVTPLCPCSTCAAAIIQSGISRVVYRMGDLRAEWAESFQVANDLFAEAHVSTARYSLE